MNQFELIQSDTKDFNLVPVSEQKPFNSRLAVSNAIMVAALTLGGCGSQEQATPTPGAVTVADFKQAVVPTFTSTPTSEATATAEPTATATSVATATATPKAMVVDPTTGLLVTVTPSSILTAAAVPEATATATVIAEPTATATPHLNTVSVSSENINVREVPCIEDNVFSQLQPGMKVSVGAYIEPDDSGFGWYQVLVDGKAGYIREDNVLNDGIMIELRSFDSYACPTPTPKPTSLPVAAAVAQPVVVAPASDLGIASTETINSGLNFSISGVPDVATNYEVASGQFVNTIGKGTESMIAEPGKLLISDYVELAVAMGISAEDAVRFVQNSGGAIELINPDNQQELVMEGQAFNVPEGGFAMVSANHGVITLSNGTVIKFNGGLGSNFLIFMRGYYADSLQDTDRNVTGKITDLTEGHGLYMRWSGDLNGGFLSEGQFMQIVADSHTGSTNCGMSGCTTVNVLFIDFNSGAWDVLQQYQTGQEWDPSTYTRIATNKQ